MNNGDITVYQHYVPQTYLQNFSIDGEYIYVAFEKNKKFIKMPIRKIGGENYFYDFSKQELIDLSSKYNLNIDFSSITQKQLCGNQPLEHFFANQIEDKLFKYIKKVISYFKNNKIEINKPYFSQEDKYMWSLYTVYQFYRTPFFRDNLINSFAKPTEKLIETLEWFQENNGVNCSDQINEMRQSIEPANIRKLHLSQMKDLNHMCGMANIHFGMYNWHIGIAPKGKYFITSDNPAVLWPRYSDPLNDLYFPISDKLCFVLHSKSAKFARNFNDLSFIEISDRVVDMINLDMVYFSKNLIFSKYSFNIEQYIDLVVGRTMKESMKLLDCGGSQCLIVKIDPIQTHPGSIFDYLNMNEFSKFGKEGRDAPLLYVNMATRIYRFGYYGSYFYKPLFGRVISQSEFINLFDRFKKYVELSYATLNKKQKN